MQKPGIDVIAREIADELMRTQPDALAAFTLEGACNELIAIANNPEFEAPEWILWIRSVLNDCDDIRDLSLGSLAKEVGLSAPHVARVFRRRFGVSMGTYAARMRLRKAYRLLSGGDSLATVALRSGFADQSHLTRSLKAAIGKTPSAVRAARSSQGAGTEFEQEVFHLKTTHGC